MMEVLVEHEETGKWPEPSLRWWYEPFSFKCAEVSRSGDVLVTSFRTVPGNSGSGVFDEEGFLVGLTDEAENADGLEPFSRGPLVASFEDLLEIPASPDMDAPAGP